MISDLLVGAANRYRALLLLVVCLLLAPAVGSAASGAAAVESTAVFDASTDSGHVFVRWDRIAPPYRVVLTDSILRINDIIIADGRLHCELGKLRRMIDAGNHDGDLLANYLLQMKSALVAAGYGNEEIWARLRATADTLVPPDLIVSRSERSIGIQTSGMAFRDGRFEHVIGGVMTVSVPMGNERRPAPTFPALFVSGAKQYFAVLSRGGLLHFDRYCRWPDEMVGQDARHVAAMLEIIRRMRTGHLGPKVRDSIARDHGVSPDILRHYVRWLRHGMDSPREGDLYRDPCDRGRWRGLGAYRLGRGAGMSQKRRGAG